MEASTLMCPRSVTIMPYFELADSIVRPVTVSSSPVYKDKAIKKVGFWQKHYLSLHI